MRKSRDGFATVRTEGAILPRDLLARIAALDKDLGGLTPDDYHLSGEKLGEATNRAWNRLQGAWAAFRGETATLRDGSGDGSGGGGGGASAAVAASGGMRGGSDPGTTPTREKWLLPLFQELGYGRLPTAKAQEIDGHSYAVSHGWGHVPIHLVGLNVDLDRRTPGVAGAAQASPHSLLQEFLNRSDEHLWGFVSNGLSLRILRDNRSLTRQAFVEFDLEAMMTGEAYADFALLYLLCHQSRVEAERPEECRLERWSRAAEAQGTRALDQLRKGVEETINALGTGFIAHPGNTELRQKLQDGTLSTQDYYRDLLRLVYRLLFVFVAEDRGLLLDPGASAEAKALYTRFYSTARLRRLAERRRGSRHADLYRGLRLVLRKLGEDGGAPEIALPALGSFLFSDAGPAALGTLEIANRDLLAAVRGLAFTTEGNIRRAIDYRNLGSEELGSVYEALLELHPEVNVPARTFALASAGGSERKTTGSYYTPTSLIQCLLDSALDPVVADALRAPDPEAALLALRVCDPACGSGHFLVAAAHRLAKRLAAARTGDEEPSPEAQRTALRDVIGHCLCGVDLNPMAAELCKVSLWMEALEPGRPLSFLDHRILCGNSLLGATPALLAAGVPDEAFKPLEGDDKKVVSELRKRNKRERAGQTTLFAGTLSTLDTTALAETVAGIDHLADDSLAGVHAKEERYRGLAASAEFRRAKMAADAWCAAFVCRKSPGVPPAVTHDVFLRLAEDPASVPAAIRDEVERLADEYGLFHWHLAFPDVFRTPDRLARAENEQEGWSGGFDVVLGNPPWDTLSPDRREFFGRWISGLRSMAPEEQQATIDRLLEDADIATQWAAHCRGLFAFVHFLKNSGVFTLYAPGNLGKGDFNVYRMFVELALRRARLGGYGAMVAPGGLYGGANASAIRKHLLDECELGSVFGLINTQRQWFEGVDIDRFAAFAARCGGYTRSFVAQFGLARPEDLSRQGVMIDADLIRSLAPDTYAIPDIRDLSQLAMSRKMYAACPAFGDTSLGPPIRHYSAELHMGSDRGLFTTDPAGLPVYEGRMIDHFDHRAKTYQSGHGNSAVWIEREFGDPGKAIVPQWRVLRENIPRKLGDRCDRFRIGFGDVANPRNVRSFVATLIPPRTICGHTVPTFVFEPASEWAYLSWLAAANSFAVDALVRGRLSSPHMTFTVLDGLPFPRPALEDDFVQVVSPLVLRLVCTAPEMTPFWNRMSAFGFVESVPQGDVPPTALVVPVERAAVRAELDAIVAARVYDLTSEELADVLDTFPVLRRREEKADGQFRTKRTILEAYEGL